jgi:hypothetical protein
MGKMQMEMCLVLWVLWVLGMQRNGKVQVQARHQADVGRGLGVAEQQDRVSAEQQDRMSAEQQDRMSAEQQDRMSAEQQDRMSAEQQDRVSAVAEQDSGRG